MFYDYLTLVTFAIGTYKCNICALFNTRDEYHCNFQAILACSEKSSESNRAFCNADEFFA